jgi:hypothetical protein
MTPEIMLAWDWYNDTANKLADRIVASVPREKLLAMTDPWELFKVDGFNCDDLGPSLFQASWALREAQRRAEALAAAQGKQADG